jgi:hypothetical protein
MNTAKQVLAVASGVVQVVVVEMDSSFRWNDKA